MNKRNYYTVDLGATSGRTILATYDGSRVEMTEVTRFPNPMILVASVRWQAEA